MVRAVPSIDELCTYKKILLITKAYYQRHIQYTVQVKDSMNIICNIMEIISNANCLKKKRT